MQIALPNAVYSDALVDTQCLTERSHSNISIPALAEAQQRTIAVRAIFIGFWAKTETSAKSGSSLSRVYKPVKRAHRRLNDTKKGN